MIERCRNAKTSGKINNIVYFIDVSFEEVDLRKAESKGYVYDRSDVA